MSEARDGDDAVVGGGDSGAVSRKKHTIQKRVDGKLRPVEYDTLLEVLGNERVMAVERKEGGFEVWEECNHYFSVQLTPEQLRELGEELIALSLTSNRL